MAFSHNQQVALALTPKISGFLSLCGSAWIVTEVLTEPSKRSNVYHRLLGAMSLWDVVISMTMGASTWPISTADENVVWALGNTHTCSMQGTVLQAGIAVPVCKHTPSSCSNIFCPPISLSSRFLFLFLQYIRQFLPGGLLPAGCQIQHVRRTTTIAKFGARPALSGQYNRWALYFIPLWIVIVLVTVIMIIVYLCTKKREINAIIESESGLSPSSNTSDRSFCVKGNAGRPPLHRSQPSFARADSSTLLLPEPMADAVKQASSRNNSSSSAHNKSSSGRSSELTATSFDVAQVLETIDGFASVKQQSLGAHAFGTRAGFFTVLVYRYSFFHRLKQRNPHMNQWELLWWSCRWSFLGPPRVARKSMKNTEAVVVPGMDDLDGDLLETDSDDSAILKPTESASMRQSLFLQTIADDMVSFDAVETGGNWYNRMELNMFALYAEFPNALTEETVRTDFPNVLSRSSFSSQQID
eukprot:scaffold2391_cov113-Cylindrotheca_fusiformis.AAC.4